MEKLNTIKYRLLDPFKLFLPTPKKVREDFLSKAKEKVDFYKPKIEEVVGVKLGEVKVKDLRYFRDDSIEDITRRKIIKEKNKLGRELTDLEINDINLAENIAKKISVLPVWLFFSLYGTELKHFKPINNSSIIYISFYLPSRYPSNKLRLKMSLLTLDTKIIHELSHALWYSILGNVEEDKERFKEFKLERLWSEGFATYCEQEYLSGIYQENTIINKVNYGIYRKGKEKIEGLVKKYGKDIVLEVPKRWEEFEGL